MSVAAEPKKKAGQKVKNGGKDGASSSVKKKASVQRAAAAKRRKKKTKQGDKAAKQGKKTSVVKVDATVEKPEAGLSKLEQKMAQTVAFIAKRDEGIANRLEEIGDHIINRYFGGDLERVASQNPQKGFSLRNLAEQKGMILSRSALQRCVAMAVQRKELGSPPSLGRLSTAHRVALLSEPDLRQKKIDIQRIITEKMSLREYLALLSERHSTPALKEPDADPIALPKPFSVSHTALYKITPETVRALSPKARIEAKAELSEMRRYINQLLGALE